MKPTRLFLLGAVLLFSSCSKKEKLRIGLNSWPGYEFLYLLNERKLDLKHGVETEIVFFNSLADGRRSFERGDLDLLGTTVVESLFIKENSKTDPKIIYVADYSNGADVIVANSAYKNIASLKGKRIGVESGSVCIYVLSLALKKHGLGLKDVEVVEADQDVLVRKLKDGSIQAGVTYPPFSVRLLSEKKFNVVYNSKESPTEILDVLVVPGRTLADRRSDYQNLLKAFEEARAMALGGDASAIEIMAKREKISPAEFTAIIQSEIKILSLQDQKDFFHGGLLKKTISGTSQALKSFGHMESEYSPDELIQGILDE